MKSQASNRLFWCALIFGALLMQFGCGGGSSGTGIGSPPRGEVLRLSGQVISKQEGEIQFARVTLLNTDQSAETDEAGSFQLNADFPGGDATLAVELPDGGNVEVVVEDLQPGSQGVELAILYDADTQTARLTRYTLRSWIVRSCAPLFLNSRTVRQTGAIPDRFVCTVETEIKLEGLPANQLKFDLESRGCDKFDPWFLVASSETGTSGPGIGEIDFEFRDDPQHCVYRIKGPTNVPGAAMLSAQIHTLTKQRFDYENQD